MRTFWSQIFIYIMTTLVHKKLEWEFLSQFPTRSYFLPNHLSYLHKFQAPWNLMISNKVSYTLHFKIVVCSIPTSEKSFESNIIISFVKIHKSNFEIISILIHSKNQKDMLYIMRSIFHGMYISVTKVPQWRLIKELLIYSLAIHFWQYFQQISFRKI